MNYSENVKDKLSIGSGVTEAGCKVIIKQRLCQAGMRWKEKGCASVLTLRALNRTGGRWDQFWSKISRYGVPTCSTGTRHSTVPKRTLIPNIVANFRHTPSSGIRPYLGSSYSSFCAGLICYDTTTHCNEIVNLEPLPVFPPRGGKSSEFTISIRRAIMLTPSHPEVGR
ncbi:MAG: hypothetical protein R3F19_16105 [Verrucomicrobiales bacterium]